MIIPAKLGKLCLLLRVPSWENSGMPGKFLSPSYPCVIFSTNSTSNLWTGKTWPSQATTTRPGWIPQIWEQLDFFLKFEVQGLPSPSGSVHTLRGRDLCVASFLLEEIFGTQPGQDFGFEACFPKEHEPPLSSQDSV